MRKAGCQIIYSAGSQEKAGTQRKRRRRWRLQVPGSSTVRGQGADPAPPSALSQPLTHCPLPRVGHPERSAWNLARGLSLVHWLNITWATLFIPRTSVSSPVKGPSCVHLKGAAVETLLSDSALGSVGPWRSKEMTALVGVSIQVHVCVYQKLQDEVNHRGEE